MNPWVVAALIGLALGGPPGALVAVLALWVLRFVLGILYAITH